MPKARTDRFVAQMCRDSYYQFFLEFWSLIAAEKLVEGWYIRELCDELQQQSERVFRDEPKDHDTIWNTPPGTSKSTAVSVLWQPWIWSRMPSARFISGSYSERLALDLSRKSRDVISSEKYKSLFPEVTLRDDQNTKGYFANTKGGIRYAVGVGGSVIGMHAHFIAIDDPIDPQAALSDLSMAESNIWMNETLSRRKVNVMLTPTVLIMQRLHQDDPTGNMLEKGNRVQHFCVAADDTWEIKPERFKKNYVNGLLDPVRLPREALDEAAKTLGEAGYAGQYGQSPIPRGGAMFKIDNLSHCSPLAIPKQWKRGPVRYWDKAATPGGGAFTVGVKMGLDDNGRIWILDVVRGQWDSGTREKRIRDVASIDGKGCRVGMEQEPGGSGKEETETSIRALSLLGFRTYADKATGDKVLRADPLSAMVNTGSVVIVQGGWNRVFEEEMRYFPVSKYKDQIDAASGAFAMLTKNRIKIGAFR